MQYLRVYMQLCTVYYNLLTYLLECHLWRVDAMLNHLTEVMSKKDTDCKTKQLKIQTVI